MSNGLALTREAKQNKNELFFHIRDSNGELITIRQSVASVKGRQVRINIQAPDNVGIVRGEIV
ncbi:MULTISPECIES: carbon storage regulator [unclassified Oleiphilus]|uniref:carbon storage regulator n=1 Tax=unclassified Oleiphilus TaxID=2631174 RepID=UPI0007C3DE95|nr:MULTISPECIES: carbon storage regulator [unclassified Oleiphilus]KZZ37876.1 hypothetical protein A3757_09635 [Oleiphilus sp. HI0117]KZZ55570.1 hypothetical protein A3761_11270 [Oleiphilus sp. HI0123]